MVLDDEQKSWLSTSLKKAGFALGGAAFNKFVVAIEASINAFCAERDASELTFREKHDQLRQLWLLAHEDDPPVGQIRARIEQLALSALAELDRHAPQVIPRLFEPWPALARRGNPRNDPIVAEALREGGFREWAKDADGEKLVRAVQVLAAGGAVIVPGRSRGGGKRSRARIEPRVMGVARGGPDPRNKGGRSSGLFARLTLVGHLAHDWENATGTLPKPSRSDHTGFGDLVHSVFQWLGEPGAEYALRRFWNEIRYFERRYAR